MSTPKLVNDPVYTQKLFESFYSQIERNQLLVNYLTLFLNNFLIKSLLIKSGDNLSTMEKFPPINVTRMSKQNLCAATTVSTRPTTTISFNNAKALSFSHFILIVSLLSALKNLN